MTSIGPLLFIVAMVGAVTMLIVSTFALRPKGSNVASVPLTLTSGSIIGLGLLFAYLHAFPIHQKADDTYPEIDATVFGAIACILVAYLLPKIKNLKIFGAEIELQEVVVDLTDNVQKISDLLEKFMSRLAIMLARMSEGTTRVEQYQTLKDFVADRLADAKLYISESASIDLRLSIWLLGKGGNLTFFLSNEINDPETTGKVFAPNEGIMGRAFVEQVTWNVGDAANSPAYTPVRRIASPRYGAILVTPISLPNQRFGVLSVDKNKNDKFSPSAEKVLEGLAAMLAIAIDAYENAAVSQAAAQAPVTASGVAAPAIANQPTGGVS